MPDPVSLRYRYKDEVPPRDKERSVVVAASDTLVLRFGDAATLAGEAINRIAERLESTAGRSLISEYLALPEQGVLVVRFADPSPEARHALQALVSAGGSPTHVEPALTDEEGVYLLYAPGEIVVRFVRRQAAPPTWLLEGGGWVLARPSLGYAPEAVVIRPGRGQEIEAIFAKAWECQLREDVVCAYPVLIRRGLASGALGLPPPWHIGGQGPPSPDDPSAKVARAWKYSEGGGVVIGIVEQWATEETHDALAGRVRGVDVSRDPAGTPQVPPLGPGPVHATMMAGFAAARSDCPAPGVAPAATVLAVQRGSGIGALAEADAIHFAGANAAGVVSCSWEPKLKGGIEAPIPPHTRWAIRWCLGHGVPVLFAAGNHALSNQSMDQNGYASCPGVIAVGACNGRGLRATYSCEGEALTCVFPSSDSEADLEQPALDLSGLEGQRVLPSPDGDYVSIPEGGTSAACACTAGVLALLLSRCPELGPGEVKALLIATCDPLPQGGQRTHNMATGYGRVNAEALLVAALASRARNHLP